MYIQIDDFRVMSQCPSLNDVYILGSQIQCPHVLLWQMIPFSCRAVVLKYNLGRMVSGMIIHKTAIDPEAVFLNPNVELRTTETAARLGPLVDPMGMDQKNRRTNNSTPNVTGLKDCPIR